MSSLELSVVIPITERGGELVNTIEDYLAGIDACGLTYEIIFVLDQRDEQAERLIDEKSSSDPRCRNIKLLKPYGDSTALTTGLSAVDGSRILILPPYAQIDASEIPKIVSKLDDFDFVVAERDRKNDSWLNRLQAGVYNYLANKASDLNINDVTCEVRAMNREVADEMDVYGDLHRFLPHLANRVGFSVGSVKVVQPQKDKVNKLYGPGVYFRRLLDILTAMFILRFTKKPLRFFGLIGIAIMLMGASALIYVVVERAFLGVALSDRPVLFIGALAIVLGLQILAIGLVGETIIFTHAKHLPEYHVREVVEHSKLTPKDQGGCLAAKQQNPVR